MINVGVIIGRFQVPTLHVGHQCLIEHVLSHHNEVVILLGVSETIHTKNNPLDFSTRSKMIKEKYPELTTLPILDRYSDYEWSENLDRLLKNIYPIANITLYGGRDSFIPHYFGKLKTKEIDITHGDSGTNLRELASNKILISSDFRSGIIYSAHNQRDKVYPTVDIAVVNNHKILMGKKPGEDKFRFPGGFVDTADLNYELSAMRELKEETNIDALNMVYICSSLIDDWRYSSNDKIMSTLFVCDDFVGIEKAKDDLSKVEWIDINTDIENIHESHRYFFKQLQRKML